ncbi:MAG: DUF4389 domain-containing protein [Oligoflexales bacterium]
MDERLIDDQMKKNLKDRNVWSRGFFMLISLACLEISKLIFLMIVIFQFCSTLLTKKTNAQLEELSTSLCKYIKQNLEYLSYLEEERPFPFSPWPSKSSVSDPSKTP